MKFLNMEEDNILNFTNELIIIRNHYKDRIDFYKNKDAEVRRERHELELKLDEALDKLRSAESRIKNDSITIKRLNDELNQLRKKTLGPAQIMALKQHVEDSKLLIEKLDHFLKQIKN